MLPLKGVDVVVFALGGALLFTVYFMLLYTAQVAGVRGLSPLSEVLSWAVPVGLAFVSFLLLGIGLWRIVASAAHQ
jgi:hypothetical protein